ncbi:two-component response regulator ARR12 [Trifolium repens]|nr:two-component response regulator ARR12 [Trifolium repens]
MAVENQKEDGVINRFPIVGMRVLAVDDNPTCLKVLDQLLRQCQYHVTTATNTIEALTMLRENRNNFDLVISDVDMPDMDGFKLLEMVGLEMDLPVIMLSGHGDKNMVYKGISHGACDYLVKPVRLSELQNIWQHVVRKQATTSKDQNRNPNISGGNSQQNKNLGKRRKDQAEEEENEEGEGTGDENDPSSQKKSRVVWSVHLHRKFVSAVNQLGLEKAVPKKILDLMNDERLTRENVASHLQKFRLYLKKANYHQANMVVGLGGGGNDSYLQINGMDGYADFCTSTGSGRFSSTTMPSYASNAVFGRLNSLAGFNMRGMSSSMLVQPIPSQNINNSWIPANQSSSFLHGIPTELNQSKLNNCATGISQLTQIDSTGFAVPSGFHDIRDTLDNANSPPQLSNHHLMINGYSQQTHNAGSFRNQSSVGSASLGNTNIGICGSSNLLDYNHCNENWQSQVQLPKFPANYFPVCESFNGNQLPRTSITAFNPRAPVGDNQVNFSSGNAITATLEDARNMPSFQEGGLIGNVIQPTSYAMQRRWEEHRVDYSQNMIRPFNPVNSQVSSSRALTDIVAHNTNQSKTVCNNGVDASFVDQVNGTSSSKKKK